MTLTANFRILLRHPVDFELSDMLFLVNVIYKNIDVNLTR